MNFLDLYSRLMVPTETDRLCPECENLECDCEDLMSEDFSSEEDPSTSDEEFIADDDETLCCEGCENDAEDCTCDDDEPVWDFTAVETDDDA